MSLAQLQQVSVAHHLELILSSIYVRNYQPAWPSIYPPNTAHIEVPSSRNNEPRQSEIQITVFRALSIAIIVFFGIPRTVVTIQGNNLASGLVDMFGWLAGIL